MIILSLGVEMGSWLRHIVPSREDDDGTGSEARPRIISSSEA
jgi:hypothetical protein